MWVWHFIQANLQSAFSWIGNYNAFKIDGEIEKEQTNWDSHTCMDIKDGIWCEYMVNLHSGGVESKLGPLGTSATYWPVVPAPGDCEDGEFGGMHGRGHRSTRRKPAPAPHCPPQIPLDQTRDWTRAAAVGSQRLTASAMARPSTWV
jgi:hypothetical protein